MMKTHSIRRQRLLITFATAGLFALNAAAAIPPAEKLLPDNTLFVLTAPDFNRLRDIYKTSPQAQFWNDPAMKPFKDHFISKWNEEFVQPLARELGVRIDDYEDLPQGQVTVAVTQNDPDAKESDPPGLLLLLDSKDKGDQLRKNLTELRKKWVDAGKPIRSERIRNVEFSVLPISGNDVPKTLKNFFNQEDFSDSDTNSGPKTEWVVGQFESLLIVGNSIKPVEKIMAHLTGGSAPALGDLAAYDANRLALFRDSPFYGWINAKALVDMAQKKKSKETSDPSNPFTPSHPDKILGALGLTGVKTVAFSSQSSSDGISIHLFVGVPESSRQGIFKLFTGEAKDSGPPPFVPGDAVKFQRWRIDGQKAWATLEKVLGDISPQWLSGINFLLDTANASAKQKDPDFDVKKNLIGNLGDDLIRYQKTPQGTTLAELNSEPSLFLIGSPQPDQFAAALKSILVLMSQRGGDPVEREFLGRKIYSVPLTALPMRPAGPRSGPRSLSYSASGGYVALTTEVSLLEEYLRSSDSQQKTLRETPGLSEAVARVGGASTGWLAYENQAETTRITFEMLRKSSATNNASSAALMPGGMNFPGTETSFKEWMDFSLLPPFEKVAKYFSFNVYTVGANTDGLTLRIFAPVPAELKK